MSSTSNVSAAANSRFALEPTQGVSLEVKKGVSGPPGAMATATYADLQKIVADAIAALTALTPEEVNGLSGKDVVFELGAMKLPFTAEGYLLSFSLPNFYFHASTAYDILRANGVPLGKRYFLGALKLKG